MTNPQPYTYADNLAYAFRKGIIRGLDDYGDNRVVPSIEEIHDAARKVMEKEENDFAVRERALFEREEIINRMHNGRKKICFPAPVDIPFKFDEYAYIGGIFFLDDVDMSLEDGLRECLQHSIDDWLADFADGRVTPKKKYPPIDVIHVDGID